MTNSLEKELAADYFNKCSWFGQWTTCDAMHLQNL